MAKSASADPAPVAVPSAQEIYAAFKVQPRLAIEFFESLGIKAVWDWQADARDASDIAFYVTGVLEQDVLLAFKEEIARAIRLGITRDKFRQFMIGRLTQLGFLGAQQVTGPDGVTRTVDVSTPYRLNTIFRTNAQTAYMAGRYLEQVKRAPQAPYWQYIAVLDSRTRATHAQMSGLVFHASDAIWQTIYPPCGFNCRCRVRAMTEESFAGSGLRCLDGSTFQLPHNFPDPGFGNNPADGAALRSTMSQRISDGMLRANGVL